MQVAHDRTPFASLAPQMQVNPQTFWARSFQSVISGSAKLTVFFFWWHQRGKTNDSFCCFFSSQSWTMLRCNFGIHETHNKNIDEDLDGKLESRKVFMKLVMHAMFSGLGRVPLAESKDLETWVVRLQSSNLMVLSSRLLAEIVEALSRLSDKVVPEKLMRRSVHSGATGSWMRKCFEPLRTPIVVIDAW